MGREINIEVIRALEKQVAEVSEGVIELKRTRNSLLNISVRLPPEILGYIFTWTIARQRYYSLHSTAHFGRLERGTYNFRLVCHYWLEVASNTPGLWSFWGDTLQSWNELCHFDRASPVNLVLDRREGDPESITSASLSKLWAGPRLRGELRDRVTRDKIGRIRLIDENPNLLGSILRRLTLNGEGAQEEGFREKCIESVIFHTSIIPKELSDFFARSRLPWLRHLEINGALRTPLWGHLTSQTTRLTTLSLQLAQGSLPPTASQLISILAANPNLRHLSLSEVLPDGIDEPEIQVPLRHLRTIDLMDKFFSVFHLLQRLELPATLDNTSLYMDDVTLEDVHQTLGPYMRGLFQRDPRFQGGLQVTADVCGYVNIYVRLPCIGGIPEPVWPSATFSLSMVGPVPDPSVLKQLSFDIMVFIPQGEVGSLQIEHTLEVPEELFIAMPKLESLRLRNVTLSDGFLRPNPNGPHADRKLLPLLRSLHLDGVTVKDDNWGPLINYLGHQTSGGRSISLQVESRSKMPPEVTEEVRRLGIDLKHSLEDRSDQGDDGVPGNGMHFQ